MSPIMGLLPGRPARSLLTRLRRDRHDRAGRTSRIHRNLRTTVVGALIGFAVSITGSRPYEAQAILYLGQPLFPGGSTPIQPLTTSFRLIDQILHSSANIRQAAAKLALPPQKLDDAVSLGAFSVAGPAV